MDAVDEKKPKVSTTIRRNFRQTINMTIKSHLLPTAQQQADKILHYYPQARKVLEQTLEQEAITKIALNQKLLLEVKQQIEQYNQAINGLNNCLQSLNLSEYQLPAIEQQETTSELVEDNNHYQSDALIAIE